MNWDEEKGPGWVGLLLLAFVVLVVGWLLLLTVEAYVK